MPVRRRERLRDPQEASLCLWGGEQVEQRFAGSAYVHATVDMAADFLTERAAAAPLLDWCVEVPLASMEMRSGLREQGFIRSQAMMDFLLKRALRRQVVRASLPATHCKHRALRHPHSPPPPSL